MILDYSIVHHYHNCYHYYDLYYYYHSISPVVREHRMSFPEASEVCPAPASAVGSRAECSAALLVPQQLYILTLYSGAAPCPDLQLYYFNSLLIMFVHVLNSTIVQQCSANLCQNAPRARPPRSAPGARGWPARPRHALIMVSPSCFSGNRIRNHACMQVS